MADRVPHLYWDDVTEDKLWVHGLTIDHALEVARGSPIIKRQAAQLEEGQNGEIRMRPIRLLLIGPDRSNRVLTFVLEYPQHGHDSRIVTGWTSGSKERAWYHQRKSK